MSDVIIITRYISCWAWQILAVIFLTSATTLILLNKTVFGVAFLFVFALCEFFSLSRKQGIEDYGNK